MLEFNEVQTTKRNTYRRKVAAAKAGKPTADDSTPKTAATAPVTPSAANTSRDPNASTLSAAASERTTAPRSKKQKPNGSNEAIANSGENGGAAPKRSRSKKEKKPAAPVGRTNRKTRSQGAAELS